MVVAPIGLLEMAVTPCAARDRRRSVRVAEAPSHGLPVTTYDRDSAGADAYWKVAMELVGRS